MRALTAVAGLLLAVPPAARGASPIDGEYGSRLGRVRVAYRMRNELSRALEWYKKALGVDPDFGDASYDMACVYALEGRREMALRYLTVPALNGYATADGMDGDPDLESVRRDAAHRALVRAKM